jgi:hypothetical protein
MRSTSLYLILLLSIGLPVQAAVTKVNRGQIIYTDALENCPAYPVPGTNRASPFVAALIPSVIDTAVSSLIGVVKKAGEDKTEEVSADSSDYFYTLDPENNELVLKNKCLIFFAGTPEVDRDIDFEDDPEFRAIYERLKTELVPRVIEADIIEEFDSVLDVPLSTNLYYEARLEVSPDGKAFRLRSNFLYVGDHLQSRRSPNGNHYLPVIDLKLPDADPSKSYASSSIPLIEGISEYSYVDPATFESLNSHSQWIPLISQSASTKSEIDGLNSALLTQKTLEVEQCLYTDSEDKDCKAIVDPVLSAGNPAVTDYVAAKMSRAAKKQALDDVVYSNANAIAQAQFDLQESTDTLELEKNKVTLEQRTEDNEKRLQRSLYCLGASESAEGVSCSQSVESGERGAEFVTWVVSMSETRPGSSFMKTLGSVLDGSKQGLVDALAAEIDPSTKAAAEEAKATLENSLRLKKQDIAVKELELQAAEGELNILRATHALLNAKLEANALADQLGMAAPYPSL